MNNKGCTLVELLTSIAVFAIGATSLLGVCTQSMSMARRAEMAYTAYNLAKNHLETLASVPFTDLASSSEVSTVLDESGVPDLSGQYIRNTEITSNYQGDANLIRAKVTVAYNMRGTASRNPMEMTSVIYRNG